MRSLLPIFIVSILACGCGSDKQEPAARPQAESSPAASVEPAQPTSLRLKVNGCDDIPIDAAEEELGEPLVFNAESPLPENGPEYPGGTICSYISADLQEAMLSVSFTEEYDAIEGALETARGQFQRVEDLESDVLGDEAFVGHHDPDTTVVGRAGNRTFSVSSRVGSPEQLVQIAESLVEPG